MPEGEEEPDMMSYSLNTPMASAEIAVEPYINKREVARRLGRTTRTVDNMMRRGVIPYYKLGYRVGFRWSEIQEHLAQTCRVLRSTEQGTKGE